MLAARNRCLRFAAAAQSAAAFAAAAASLILAEKYFRDHVDGSVASGELIRGLAQLLALAGWVVIASAFGPEVDWRRLRLGGGLVVASLFGSFAGTMVQVISILGDQLPHDYRPYLLFSVLSGILAFAGGAVALSALGDSVNGVSRTGRLRLGASVAAASFLAASVSQLFWHSYLGAFAVPEIQMTGSTVVAVGAFATAIAAAVFARWATSSFEGRESAVFSAALVGALATLVVMVGEALQAVGYHQVGTTGSELVHLWLLAVSRALITIVFVFLALGARRAVRA
jgi:hypothetical protein